MLRGRAVGLLIGVVGVLLTAVACDDDGEGGTGGSGGSSRIGFPTGGSAPLGGTPAGGGTAATGGSGAATTGGSGGTANTSSCRFALGGTACSGGSCDWKTDCSTGRCECQNGRWACSETQQPCGGTCPAPQQARCGDACTGQVMNCLCQCGGPNYATCACVNSRWQCACGGN